MGTNPPNVISTGWLSSLGPPLSISHSTQPPAGPPSYMIDQLTESALAANPAKPCGCTLGAWCAVVCPRCLVGTPTQHHTPPSSCFGVVLFCVTLCTLNPSKTAHLARRVVYAAGAVSSCVNEKNIFLRDEGKMPLSSFKIVGRWLRVILCDTNYRFTPCLLMKRT